ncbi:hypothetical protein DFJ74DRAFT_676216 [Hyaloraphidium curvatum]|nr:hypothetical protein DFJ74DRAFT_676216 [Hyaloraphidium curvatum]
MVASDGRRTPEWGAIAAEAEAWRRGAARGETPAPAEWPTGDGGEATPSAPATPLAARTAEDGDEEVPSAWDPPAPDFPPPPRDPMGAPLPVADLMLGLDSFWQRLHTTFPVVHRASFEAAFTRPGGPMPGTPLFPRGAPLMLLHTLAGFGALFLEEVPNAKRAALAKACCERAKVLALATFDTLPARDDLELGLACYYLVGVAVVAGQPAAAAPLIRRTAETAEALFRALPQGPPQTAAAWLWRECVLRLRIGTAHADIGQAHLTGLPAFGNYFSGACPLPSPEPYFEARDGGAAFSMAQLLWLAGEPVVDFGRDPSSGEALVGCSASLARHALSTSSSTALYQLAQLLRHAACEAQHRAPAYELSARTWDVSLALDAAIGAMPADVRGPLSKGDPGPFLDHCTAHHGDFPHASAALQCVVLCFGLVVFAFSEAGMPVQAVRRSLVLAGLLSGLAKRDPTFATASFAIAVPAYAAGRAVLRCIREPPASSRPEALYPAARELCAALELLAARMGLQVRRVAAVFAAEMDEAGVPPDAGFFGELLGIEAGTLASRGFSGGLRSATLSAEEEAAEVEGPMDEADAPEGRAYSFMDRVAMALRARRAPVAG